MTATVYSYKTGSNTLRITFTSDLSISSTGYSATWEIVRRNSLVEDLGNENFFSNSTGLFCINKTLEENSGWIENMGFGVEENVEAIKFEHDSPVDCWFSIVAPGKPIIINFSNCLKYLIEFFALVHEFKID